MEVGRVGSAIDSISQELVLASSAGRSSKLALLRPLITPGERTIVFVQKKHVAAWVRRPPRRRARSHARLRATAVRGASALLTAWAIIPRSVLLPDDAVVWFLTHRLGLQHPSFPTPPLTCRGGRRPCPSIPPLHPASPTHRPALFASAPLCLHFLGCGARALSLQRHNSVCRVLVSAVARELGASPSFTEKLFSDAESRRLVDAVFTVWSRLPSHFGVDATVACPLLPSLLAQSSSSASAIFDRRDAEKRAKHRFFSSDPAGERALIVIAVTTLGGIGPVSFWEWFDGAFAEAVAREIALGAPGREALQRKSLVLQHAQSVLVRACADMVAQLAL